jgi:hypothetical protein
LATSAAAFARLTAKGQVDTTFGANGIAEIIPPGSSGSGTATLGVNGGGKVVSVINAGFTAGYSTNLTVSVCH